MAGNTLSDWTVNFTAKGIPSILSGAGKLKSKLTEHLTEYEKLSAAIKRIKEQRESVRIGRMAEEMSMTTGMQIDRWANRAAVGFAVLSGATMGWVTAGMSGTVEAYQLQQSFSYLSREIAGVFAPTIRDVVDGIRSLTRWFRGMSGEQQATIRNVVLFTGGLLVAVTTINMMRKAVLALSAAFGLMRLTGIAAGAGATAAAAGGSGMLGMLGMAGRLRSAAILGGVGLAAYGVNEATKGGANKTGIVEDLGEGLGKSLSAIWNETGGRLTRTGGERDANRRKRELEWREYMPESKGGKLNAAEKDELAKLRGDANKKESLSLNQTGFEGIGGAWDRMSNEILKQDALLAESVKTNETLASLVELARISVARGSGVVI